MPVAPVSHVPWSTAAGVAHGLAAAPAAPAAPPNAPDAPCPPENMLVMGKVQGGAITFAYPEDAKRNLIVQRKQ